MANTLVKVWNDNSLEHIETFKGQEIKIPAHGYVTMNRHEAVEFKSQFKSPVFLKGGVPDPAHKKMIRVEPINDDKIEETQAPDDFDCQKCGFVAKSAAGLKSHIRANHLQSVADSELRKELSQEA